MYVKCCQTTYSTPNMQQYQQQQQKHHFLWVSGLACKMHTNYISTRRDDAERKLKWRYYIKIQASILRVGGSQPSILEWGVGVAGSPSNIIPYNVGLRKYEMKTLSKVLSRHKQKTFYTMKQVISRMIPSNFCSVTSPVEFLGPQFSNQDPYDTPSFQARLTPLH